MVANLLDLIYLNLLEHCNKGYFFFYIYEFSYLAIFCMVLLFYFNTKRIFVSQYFLFILGGILSYVLTSFPSFFQLLNN